MVWRGGEVVGCGRGYAEWEVCPSDITGVTGPATEPAGNQTPNRNDQKSGTAKNRTETEAEDGYADSPQPLSRENSVRIGTITGRVRTREWERPMKGLTHRRRRRPKHTAETAGGRADSETRREGEQQREKVAATQRRRRTGTVEVGSGTFETEEESGRMSGRNDRPTEPTTQQRAHPHALRCR